MQHTASAIDSAPVQSLAPALRKVLPPAIADLMQSRLQLQLALQQQQAALTQLRKGSLCHVRHLTIAALSIDTMALSWDRNICYLAILAGFSGG